jgi:hypothetical protein
MNAAIILLIQPGNYVPAKKPNRVWLEIGKAHHLSHDACIYYLVNRIDDQWYPCFEIHQKNHVISKSICPGQDAFNQYFDLSTWFPLLITVRAIEIINGAPQRVLVEGLYMSELEKLKHTSKAGG